MALVTSWGVCGHAELLNYVHDCATFESSPCFGKLLAEGQLAEACPDLWAGSVETVPGLDLSLYMLRLERIYSDRAVEPMSPA